MKKWTKVVIAVVVVAVLVAWYAFRPERLFVNRHVNEAMPAGQGSRGQTISGHRPCSASNPDGSTALRIRRQAPQPSSRWEMGFVFFA